MLARLLATFPSVRTERELAVAEERVRAAASRIVELNAERLELLARIDALQRRFDRLVEARLLKDGAIATLLTDPPAENKPIAPAQLFANIGRLVDRRPPTTADPDDDLDSIPAGATMRP